MGTAARYRAVAANTSTTTTAHHHQQNPRRRRNTTTRLRHPIHQVSPRPRTPTGTIGNAEVKRGGTKNTPQTRCSRREVVWMAPDTRWYPWRVPRPGWSRFVVLVVACVCGAPPRVPWRIWTYRRSRAWTTTTKMKKKKHATTKKRKSARPTRGGCSPRNTLGPFSWRSRMGVWCCGRTWTWCVVRRTNKHQRVRGRWEKLRKISRATIHSGIKIKNKKAISGRPRFYADTPAAWSPRRGWMVFAKTDRPAPAHTPHTRCARRRWTPRWGFGVLKGETGCQTTAVRFRSNPKRTSKPFSFPKPFSGNTRRAYRAVLFRLTGIFLRQATPAAFSVYGTYPQTRWRKKPSGWGGRTTRSRSARLRRGATRKRTRGFGDTGWSPRITRAKATTRGCWCGKSADATCISGRQGLAVRVRTVRTVRRIGRIQTRNVQTLANRKRRRSTTGVVTPSFAGTSGRCRAGYARFAAESRP